MKSFYDTEFNRTLPEQTEGPEFTDYLNPMGKRKKRKYAAAAVAVTAAAVTAAARGRTRRRAPAGRARFTGCRRTEPAPTCCRKTDHENGVLTLSTPFSSWDIVHQLAYA